MSLPKNILIAPLNWGLGHAARCVPIINALLEKNHNVILASDGVALKLLQQEFPKLVAVELPSYQITYPESGNFILQMAKLVPGILRAIKLENAELAELVKTHNVDVVISDNRYGMYCAGVKSIFITHQIIVASPVGENILASIQQKFLRHFDAIWIPDFEGQENMSGKLAHNGKVPENAKYIGGLSRFTDELKAEKPNALEADRGFVLAVISGPEPQRSVFEKVLINQLSLLKTPVVLVGGNPNGESIKTSKNITHYSFLGAKHLKWLFQNAEYIISRSGYSTIMDLVAMNKQAILIPTPGQTEQEYLVKHLANTGLFFSMNQSEFDIQKALIGMDSLPKNTAFFEANPKPEFYQIINTI